MHGSVILFAIALTLLKILNLFIRPHLRKAIRAFLKDTTLKLDTLSFEDMSRKLCTPEALFCITVQGYFAWLVIIEIALVFPVATLEPKLEITILQLIGLGVLLVTLVAGWRWPLPGIDATSGGRRNEY